MNLVIVQDQLRSGGTERQSVLLADAFSELGWKSTILTFRPGGALAGSPVRAEQRSLQPFDLHLDWFAPRLLSTLRGMAPDVVLCMGRMANCHAGEIKAALPGATVVGTMRTGKPLPRRYSESLRQVDHVIANSQDARDTLKTQYSVPEDKISVIVNSLVFRPLGVDMRNEALRAQQGAGMSTQVFLNVSMFRPEKNHCGLIEIVEDLPTNFDFQLWLVGDGPTLGDCKAQTEDLGLTHRVKFLGWMRDPSMAYAAADIAVHASKSEALSNFLIEAQAHGLPVVAYRAQGNSECVLPGKTGFIINQGDEEAFRKALRRLAADTPDERAQRSAAARDFARSTFDHSKQIAAYLHLFRILRAR